MFSRKLTNVKSSVALPNHVRSPPWATKLWWASVRPPCPRLYHFAEPAAHFAQPAEPSARRQGQKLKHRRAGVPPAPRRGSNPRSLVPPASLAGFQGRRVCRGPPTGSEISACRMFLRPSRGSEWWKASVNQRASWRAIPLVPRRPRRMNSSRDWRGSVNQRASGVATPRDFLGTLSDPRGAQAS